MRYVALLRGINVGGNNKVEMARLKFCFEKAGFLDVLTYINSGNIIFSSSVIPKVQKIETTIEREFGFRVPAIVRNAETIKKIVEHVPADWANDTHQKTDVLFLWDEVNNQNVASQFKVNPKFESLIYIDGVMVWNIQREFINKSQIIKIVGTKFYKQVTIRNINTVRKLHSLMEKV